MNSRHRPLHACGVSIFAIAHIASRKTQDFNGVLGSTWRRKVAKLAKFSCPLISAIQYQLLSILSFLDDHILVVEKMIEKLFPSSAFAFDKIDDLVLAIMSLPEKFDDAVNKFPEIIHQVPFIECALVHVISCLNCLISTLNHWGLENSRIKEITIDLNKICSEKLESSESSDKVNIKCKERFLPTSEASEALSKGVGMAVSTQEKGSYREAWENGKKENLQKNIVREKEKMEKEWQSQKIEGGECGVRKGKEKDKDRDKEDEGVNVKYQVGRNGGVKEEDPLLGLFESGWHMKPVT